MLLPDPVFSREYYRNKHIMEPNMRNFFALQIFHNETRWTTEFETVQKPSSATGKPSKRRYYPVQGCGRITFDFEECDNRNIDNHEQASTWWETIVGSRTGMPKLRAPNETEEHFPAVVTGERTVPLPTEKQYFSAKYASPGETGSILVPVRKMSMMVYRTELWGGYYEKIVTVGSKESNFKFLYRTFMSAVFHKNDHLLRGKESTGGGKAQWFPILWTVGLHSCCLHPNKNSRVYRVE